MRLIIKELEELKKLTDFMINNKDITDKKDLEKFLLNFEKIRYEILSKIKLNNKIVEKENEKINYINDSYKAFLKDGILKIYIPETLPKFKNISNFAYKNIMISTANAVKE